MSVSTSGPACSYLEPFERVFWVCALNTVNLFGNDEKINSSHLTGTRPK